MRVWKIQWADENTRTLWFSTQYGAEAYMEKWPRLKYSEDSTLMVMVPDEDNAMAEFLNGLEPNM